MTATSMIQKMLTTPPTMLRIPVEKNKFKCGKMMFLKKTCGEKSIQMIILSETQQTIIIQL